MYYASWSIFAGALVRISQFRNNTQGHQLPLHILGGALAGSLIPQNSKF